MNSVIKPIFDTHESRVRFLRDQIYYRFDSEHQHFCSDANWRACKDKWLEPDNVMWLERNQPKNQP